MPREIDWSPAAAKARKAALITFTVYLAVAGLWILLSDHVVVQLTDDPRRIQWLQTIKGWGFISVTGLLLYGLVHRRVYVALRSSEIERKAHYDPVTALPNSALLASMMRHALALAAGHGQGLSVLAIGVDNLRRIRESLGEAAADHVIVQLGERIRSVLGARHLLARHEADAFVAVLDQSQEPEDRKQVSRAIMRAMARLMTWDEAEFRVAVSIGASQYPEDGATPAELISCATMAMRQASQSGSWKALDYTGRFRAAALEEFRIESELRKAADTGSFSLVFQPQIRLRDRRPVGVEALLRWEHPELGAVSPDRFIPIAEATGLIQPIGEWVLRAACEEAARWSRLGLPPLRLAVNLSGGQFRNSRLVAQVERVLAATGLPAEHLELEITETAAMAHPDRTIRIVRDLKDLGIHVAIDDFGTGYSSLNYLRDFAVDRLKIDRSFVDDIVDNGANLEICRAVISLCRSLHLGCLAEGIETEAQRRALQRLRCMEGQGFLFARPMGSGDFVRWLRSPMQVAGLQEAG